MREDYQAVLDEAGFGKKIIGFPAAPADLDAAGARGAAPLAALQVGLRDGVEGLVRLIEKAERMLGYAPKYSNKDALVRNFEWYLRAPGRVPQAPRASPTACPWKQGDLGLAKRFF